MTLRRHFLLLGLLILLIAVLGGYIAMRDSKESDGSDSTDATQVIEDTKTIVVAGDISCDVGAATSDFACRSKDTAALISVIDPDAVLTVGDNQYPKGSFESYINSYDKTWGAFVDKTYPTPGNHEYATPGASGYYDYFGSRAGDRDKGYYTFTVGKWRLYALNSEIDVSANSPQLTWLTAELARNTEQCSLAYWHKPRFSTGLHENAPAYDALWRLLYANGVDVVVNGHSHNYERFVAQNPDGQPDPDKGITEFVSGLGGYGTQEFGQLLPTLAVRQNHSFGVLLFTLHATKATYEFMSLAGVQNFTDEGTITCH